MGYLLKHLIYLGISLIYPILIYLLVAAYMYDLNYYSWSFGVQDFYISFSQIMFIGSYTILVWNENKWRFKNKRK
jgi:hypothetical protein